MTSLGKNQRVIQLARDLGLSTKGDCLVHIENFALAEVDKMIAGLPVSDLDKLCRIVCNRLSLKIEMIKSDEDVDRIADKYTDFHPVLKQQLRLEFLKSTTEGITLVRDGSAIGQFDYLAVIDTRGERGSRAYFTTWHEITHLILLPPSFPFPQFRRSPTREEIKKDPI